MASFNRFVANTTIASPSTLLDLPRFALTLTASTTPSSVRNDENACTFKKWAEQPNQPGFFRIFTIISVLAILVVLVVLGNALVIAAVIMRRRLRSATGLLILSLAAADLMVGLVILPFSIANEVLHSYWIFGDTWCTVWLTMDIWMCTASIYNLVAISIDRYIAIIKPLNYPMLVTKFRARCIVAAVWISSFVICSPSFLLASSDKQASVVGRDNCRCTPANSGVAYIVFSASSSFYIPMVVVIFVYVRIYIAACAATKSVYSGMMQVTATAIKNPKNLLMQNPTALSRQENVPVLRIHRGSTIRQPSPQSERIRSRAHISPLARVGSGEAFTGSVASSITTPRPSPPSSTRTNGNANFDRRRFERAPRCQSQEERKNGDIVHKESAPAAFPSAFGSRLRTSALAKCAQLRRSASEVDAASASCGGEGDSRDSVEMQPSGHNRPGPFDASSSQSEGASGTPTPRSRHHSSDLLTQANRRGSRGILVPLAATNGDVNKGSGVLQPRRCVSSPALPRPTNTSIISEAANSLDAVSGSLLRPNALLQLEKTGVKKPNYGMVMWNRILRRGPRKKAGCAYEKRLSLEIKAAKTVAIVTGCFIFCWLGFSILYGLSIETNEVVWSVVFWLGYLNSALNPVIYTVFNREFRTCFKRLLTCNHLLFTSNAAHNQYNSYNSTLRPGKPIAGFNSYTSVHGGVRSSGANYNALSES